MPPPCSLKWRTASRTRAGRLLDVDPHRRLPTGVPILARTVERGDKRNRRVDDDDIDPPAPLDRSPPQRPGIPALREVRRQEQPALLRYSGAGRFGAARLLANGRRGVHRRRAVRARSRRRSLPRPPSGESSFRQGRWRDSSRASRQAAVDRQQVSGYAAGEVAREKQCGSGDVVNGGEAPKRRQLGARWRAALTARPPSRSRRCIAQAAPRSAMGPGATAFTRIPRPPRSSAAERTMPRTACLLAT